MGKSLSCLACEDEKLGEEEEEDVEHHEPSCATKVEIDSLVLDTLGNYRTIVDHYQDPPRSMVLLYSIAKKEEGWLRVVKSMINVIPVDNPVGHANITLLMDECPLPSRETILKFIRDLNLCRATSIKGRRQPDLHRNIAVILGCIAEKLAGPRSVDIFTQDVQDYLLTNLDEKVDPAVILFSIVALEKFSQTSENKYALRNGIGSSPKDNPFLRFESWANRKDFLERQVGVVSQWLLDNIIFVQGRPFSYENVDMNGINVILNSNDVSQYLKISPDGLEARCDAFSFESVRCTFQIDEGVWFYEVVLITAGVMQIGWATKNSKFLNHDGYGIGDDKYSLAFDGCRQLIWHSALIEEQNVPCWKPGDVLGSLLDFPNRQIIFYFNGSPLKPFSNVFNNVESGFFAAASFMSFQQCRFNFGATPYIYPPTDKEFKSFNDYGSLRPEEKIILPRHMRLENQMHHSINENACMICFDEIASIVLEPCGHKGFCDVCANQLKACPMCRAQITSLKNNSISVNSQ